MNPDPKRTYFDGIAPLWDQWMDPDDIAARLRPGVNGFGIGPDETVVDVGCGTGNLTRVLLEHLSDKGRVVAVDLSDVMLFIAREKNPDPRVRWIQSDVTRLPLEDGEVDRVICFSVWPHLDDPAAVLAEFRRVLAPGGFLHVWHIDSRETINHVHAEAGEAVRADVLVPASELSAMTREAGYEVTEVADDEARYLVTARR